MDLTEKTLDSTCLYDGRIIKLRNDRVSLPDGRESMREVVEHPGGVAVVALCDNNDVLMVRQYRYPFETVIEEIPAGKLEKGEELLECGQRELKEETGATAKEWIYLGYYLASVGYTTEKTHIFLARGLTIDEMTPDEGEFLQLFRIPFKKAVKKAANGEINDAKTITALFRANYKLGDIK